MTPTQEAAMRLALEALDCPGKAKTADEQAAITALRSALAEPVQEPASDFERGFQRGWQRAMRDRDRDAAIRTKVEDELAATVARLAEHEQDTDCHLQGICQRSGYSLQRKPLTEEQIKSCEKQAMVNGALPFEQRVLFARAIEAMHGIR